MMRVVLGSLAVIVIGFWVYLFRPFLSYPEPAAVTCLDQAAGRNEPLGEPRVIYGLGLSYAGHIAESPGLYDPEAGPPVFKKRPHSVVRTGEVSYPSREVLLAGAAEADPEHAKNLGAELGDIPPLLDYEVEIGIAVLESIPVEELQRPAFAPPLGFFVANDLTARILIGMAPTFDDTVEYLAEGKSLPTFLPVGETMWIPNVPLRDGWPCVSLETDVNGELRQQSPSADIILPPREILATVARTYDLSSFERGDWIITGTPPGVALQTPGWLQRAMRLVDPPATMKVRAMAGSAESGRFLKPGDRVTVRAGFLGDSQVEITPPR